MLINKFLFLIGVVNALLSFVAFYIEKTAGNFFVSPLLFFVTIFVFAYSFVYRNILLQQRAKGKSHDHRLISQLRGLGLLLIILSILYVVILGIVFSNGEPIAEPL